jgi:hypothetical protein
MMMTETKEITNTEDVIDVRDIMARFEELETKRNASPDETALIAFNASEEGQEYDRLKSLLEDLCGNGGDEEWRGAWYPVTLIRSSYFQDYAQELAEDIGAINRDAAWPNNHIDWESAAEELSNDYGNVEFDGVEYPYR